MLENPRRAAVVSRHPATLRQLALSLGVGRLTIRQAIGPAFLPRSGKGEFEIVILDLDVDPSAPPLALVEAVSAACPESPVVVVAGIDARMRLLEALKAPMVCALHPKLSGFGDGPTPTKEGATDGADEQEMGITVRRITAPESIPQGPLPYLAGATLLEERVVSGSAEKEAVLSEVLRFAERFGLAEEKMRRIEVVTDELLLNAIYNAPRDPEGQPKYAGLDRRTAVTLGAQAQVRLRWGSDGRKFVISVADRFGALSRATLTGHLIRALDQNALRPRDGSGGAGLGLLLSYNSANLLAVHCTKNRFTEITAVVHVAGSNRQSTARGSSLQLYF